MAQVTRARSVRRPPPAVAPERPLIPEHYPTRWEEFVGQEQAKEHLQMAAQSAKIRGVPMEHALITSPLPGVGKTSLALLTIQELGTNYRIETGPIKPAQVPFIFSGMKDGDVLYLDEVHRLFAGGKTNGEWLIYYLQDGMMQTLLGLRPAPRVTVIASTTDKGKIPEPILDRFENVPTIDPYTPEEGALIAMQLARKILTPVKLPLPIPEVAEQIARAGKDSPRHMKRVLIHLRDQCITGRAKPRRGNYELDRAFELAGVTEDGLSIEAQKYLIVLRREYGGTPAGKQALGERLGEVGAGIARVEKQLLDQGLIGFTGRGRVLTDEGIKRAGELDPEEGAA